MWLVRVRDHQLVKVVYEKRPEYAILSHRWDEKEPEVSFQDLLDPTKASAMPNFNKILNACNQASLDGLGYVWIDTCCINKESSAELSEAINSMYQWYKGAKVCYAFLGDVQGGADTEDILDQISNSEWFERGWTLQELIAPDIVHFFNRSWKRLGTKLSLRVTLTARTGVNTAVLTGWEPPSSRSVAERMSWASQRKTTRVEDEAYCLLGIFGVNMPMLYGEGARAFIRLQEEIMKNSDDQSIFAWPLPESPLDGPEVSTTSLPDSIEGRSNRVRRLYGLLADSPSAFKTCGTVGRKSSRQNIPPYTMTNRGLSISLWSGVVEMDTYLARLNCDDSSITTRDEEGTNDRHLGIFLTCLDGDEQFARVASYDGQSVSRVSSELYESFTTLHFYVPQYREYASPETSSYDVLRPRFNGVRLQTPSLFDFYELVALYHWNEKTHLLSQSSQPGYHEYNLAERGVTLDIKEDLSTETGEIKKITFGFDRASNPVCFVATAQGLQHDLELEPTSSILIKNRGFTTLEQSKTRSHPFWTRRPFDDLEWSSQLRGRERVGEDEGFYQVRWSKNVYAMELTWYSGVWAIRGDRVEGMSAYILPADSSTPLGHLRVKRSVIQTGPWRGHLVWDVWFSNPPFVEDEPSYDEVLPVSWAVHSPMSP